MFLCRRLLRAIPGVDGLLADPSDSVSVPSDGIDSVDMDRREATGPRVVLLSKLLLASSISSGGLRSIPHDLGLDADIEGC